MRRKLHANLTRMAPDATHDCQLPAVRSRAPSEMRSTLLFLVFVIKFFSKKRYAIDVNFICVVYEEHCILFNFIKH